MMNWKTRIKNKTFWLALVPAILLLAQVVAVPFGYKFDIDLINKQLLDIVNAAFAVLTIVGIVADPTTAGITDKGDK
ncbi:phage holin [Loigolactobacillus jiayinensis]|uniref:Phage holin n=1 Tax=Loigolactobacillus jiayinensis TaxID=2486016 RepID=A0ABW1RC36_9LACO|nr:phage holin [Loigolactobacillus jiayinensis]